MEELNKTTRHSENLDLEVENQHGSYKVRKHKFNIPLVIALTTGFWKVNYLLMSFALPDEWFDSS